MDLGERLIADARMDFIASRVGTVWAENAAPIPVQFFTEERP